MSRLSWSALCRSLSLLCLLHATTGCGTFGEKESRGPSPEQQTIENLTQSVDLLRETLRITAEERDGYKQSYQGSTTELRARAADTEYLEARVRLHRAEIKGLQSTLASREERIRSLDSELAASNVLVTAGRSEAARLQALNDRLSAECTRLEGIVASETAARELLTTQVTQAEERAKSGQRAGTEQVAELQRSLEASHQESQQLKAQVAQLKADVVAAETQARAALAAGGVPRSTVVVPAVSLPAPKTTPPTTAEPASNLPTSAGSKTEEPELESKGFVVGWATRSWRDAKAGQWNESNLSFFGMAVGGVLLGLMLLMVSARSRRARNEAEQLLQRLEQEQAKPRPVVAPMSRPQPSPQPAMAGSQRGTGHYLHGEPTIAMPSVVPPAPAFLPPEAPTQSFMFPNSDAAAVTSELSDADFDPCVTQRIDLALDDAEIESASQRGRRSMGATRGQPPAPVGGGVNEDALLADLKSVISEKFTELKHKKK